MVNIVIVFWPTRDLQNNFHMHTAYRISYLNKNMHFNKMFIFQKFNFQLLCLFIDHRNRIFNAGLKLTAYS